MTDIWCALKLLNENVNGFVLFAEIKRNVYISMKYAYFKMLDFLLPKKWLHSIKIDQQPHTCKYLKITFAGISLHIF